MQTCALPISRGTLWETRDFFRPLLVHFAPFILHAACRSGPRLTLVALVIGRAKEAAMFTNTRSIALLSFAAMLVPLSGQAATDTATFNVKLTITSSCDVHTVAPTDMDFGTSEIGRAHVCTPVTNAHLVFRLLLEK